MINPHCRIGRVYEKAWSNVRELPVITSLPCDPSRILWGALEANLQMAIIVGVDEFGELYLRRSDPNHAESLWWLQMACMRLLQIGNGDVPVD